MQHAVTLDISSPLHTSQSYNAASLKSIPILILSVTIQEECFRLSAGPLLAALNTQTD